MASEGMIVMSQRESRRLQMIQQALEKKITQRKVAQVLGLTDRQVRRIVKRVREEGAGGICHQGRGQPSNRKIAAKMKQKVLSEYRKRYANFGPTLAVEKLSEREGLQISKETLRGWLIAEGLWKQARKGRTHRRWRQRKEHFGEMVQVDGSHHDWLEGRGPACVLMAYIDDATNKVDAKFYDHEGTYPAMESFFGYLMRYGIPQRLYLDRHSTYKAWAKPTIAEQLEGIGPMTQFERAVRELGVDIIYAYSPQAKGRIERLFRTLQDRMVKEMRLLGIATLQEANLFLKKYLPMYNRQFSYLAANPSNLHRPIPKGTDLKRILSVQHERAVRNDQTVVHHGKLYQIQEKCSARKVMIEERLDGRLYLMDQDQSLKYKEITERPIRPDQTQNKPFNPRKANTPKVDHPWNRSYKPNRKEINVSIT